MTSFGDGFPKGLGVLFDINRLGGGAYGYKAWRVFMGQVSSKELPCCLLVDGDTTRTLIGGRNEFCIGVYGDVRDFRVIRERFEVLDEPGLVEMPRRMMEKPALDAQPLVVHGSVDAWGRLVTKQWDSSDLGLCQEFGWGYLPEDAPEWLQRIIEEMNVKL